MSDDGKPNPQLKRDENPADSNSNTEKTSEAGMLLPELRQIVEQAGLPSAKKEQLLGQIAQVVVEHHFSGPLPHPEILQGYAELIPNGAERIMGLTERQSAHRVKQEDRVIFHEIIQTYSGQFMAFGLCLAFLYASFQLGMAGHDVLAGILGGTTIVGLATVFILGRNKQDKDLREKRPSGPPPKSNKRVRGR